MSYIELDKDKHYALRIPQSLFDHLDAVAYDRGMSVNSLMNLLLAGGLGHRYEVSVARLPDIPTT